MDTARADFDTTDRGVGVWKESLGVGELVAAVQDFDQRWKAGREVIESYFVGTAKVARDIAAALQATDQYLADKTPGHVDGQLRMDF